MKKNIIRFITIILLFSAVLAACTSAAASYPQPSKEFFVNDYAGVLSSDTKQEIVDIGSTLQNKTTAQVVVVLIKSLNGQDIDDYSLGLGRAWGIGQKGKNNGVLIVAAMDDHKDAIEIGYGLEGAITDAESGRIRRGYIEADFKKGDYDAGILDAYKIIAKKVYEEYNITPPANLKDSSVPDEGISIPFSNAAGVILGIVILAVIFGSRSFRGPRGPFGRRRYNRGGFYGGFGGFGGFGGGSGGGNGGFSGGGGSFGGGGSSGGW